MNPTSASDLVPMLEVCQRLQVSDQTIRAWAKKGWLRVTKIGRTVYVTERELQRLIDRKTH